MSARSQWLLIIGCVLFCDLIAKNKGARGQPNIVFIVADDLVSFKADHNLFLLLFKLLALRQ